MQERGPKLVAVSDDTCPHCVNYKPTWNSFGKMFGRRIHMISMPSTVYNKTPLAEKKNVNSVPTVLLVSPDGTVSEVNDIRNKKAVDEAVSSIDSSIESTPVSTSKSNLIPIILPTSSGGPVTSSGGPVTTTEQNPLRPLPGQAVQVGGNPWAAFMAAATQAGPAAALMGAYSLLPNKRSSGLMNPIRSRKSRKSRH